MRLHALLVVVAVAGSAAAAPVPPVYDDAALYAVTFADGNEGWAVGDEGAVWHTIDGGKTWERQKTGTRASLRGVQFLTPYTGFIAGRQDRGGVSVGVLLKTTDAGLTWNELTAHDLPPLHAVQFLDEQNGTAVGEGCEAFPSGAFVTKDGGTTWAMLPGERATWHGLAMNAARGGTLTSHRGDEAELLGGRVVRVERTRTLMPNLAGASFHAKATHGASVWMAGRPGSVIYFSSDNGTTWEARPTGVTAPLHALHMLSSTEGFAVGEFGAILATKDGGKTWTARRMGGQRAAVLFASANLASVPAAAIPALHAEGYLATALSVEPTEANLRSLGAATTDSLNGDAGERNLVLAIRTWKPEVIVSDLPGMPSAFRRAGDATAYPEQLSALALAPHAAKKLYAPSAAGTTAKLDTGAFRADLADTPAGVAGTFPELLAFQRIDAPEANAALMDGIALARGGPSRRAAGPAWTPAYVASREAASQTRAALAAQPGDWPPQQEKLLAALKSLPDDDGASALLALARRAFGRGEWTLARELFTLTASRYPTHPQSAEAFRWLVRYHASGEALRRLELGQTPTMRPTVFFQMPATGPQIVQAGYAPVLNPKVKFRSSEAEREWVGTGVDTEGGFFAAHPLAARDPGTHLAMNAARLRMGLNADAERDLMFYRRSMGASRSPLFDAIQSELWLANRGSAPAPAKPLATCRATATRPKLDGKLDEEFWREAKAIAVNGPASDKYPTTAFLANDDEFLYLAVTCGHPDGAMIPKADSRKRDEDLTQHDRIELMLDIDRDYATYYRFGIDQRGCVAEDCWGDASWNPRWFVAVNPTPGGWTLEAAIPLSELTGSRPRPGQAWAMNVTRVVPGRSVLAWSGPGDASPRPERMGLLEFTR